jgi:flagellar biosynthetic protein FliQ
VNQDTVVHLALQGLMVTLKVAGPVLLASLVIGLLVSIFQAITQIQELTLAFIPKIIAVGVVIAFAGPWMLDQMLSWTHEIFAGIPNVVGR